PSTLAVARNLMDGLARRTAIGCVTTHLQLLVTGRAIGKPQRKLTDMDLHSDILEVIASSRFPMSTDDIWQDVRIWPLSRGEKMRVVSVEEVTIDLSSLVHDGEVESVSIVGEQRYRIPRVVKHEEKQMELFR